MAGLRAGGLALIIKSRTPADVGKVVTTERVLINGERFIAPDGTGCWWRHGDGCWLVTGDIKPENDCPYYGWAAYSASNLMPIDDGDPDAVGELTKDKPAELTA